MIKHQTVTSFYKNVSPDYPIGFSRLFLDQKDALAEKKFNLIKQRVLARKGKSLTEKDFVDKNITQTLDRDTFVAKLERIKSRQVSAKRRKSLNEEERHKKSFVIQHRKPFIKLIRDEAISTLKNEL